MSCMQKLSIIIPIYNEEKGLEKTIEFFENLLQESPDSEIIFVNDASTDGSARILNTIKDDRIKVLNHTVNKGYGAAIKTGVKNSLGEYVALTDADGSYPNEKISVLYRRLTDEKADMAIGTRTGTTVKIGVLRKFAKFILRKLAEYLSGEKILDLNSGLRVIKKEVVLKFLRFLPDGFSFTTTITLCCMANNYKIITEPINYYAREGKSKIRPIKDTLSFIQLIIFTIMYFNPLKIFLPLSFFLFLASVSVLLYSYFFTEKVMDITTVILFVASLQVLALGMVADLIVKRVK